MIMALKTYVEKYILLKSLNMFEYKDSKVQQF